MFFTNDVAVRAIALATLLFSAVASASDINPGPSSTTVLPSELTREQAISLALERNPEYQAAKAEVEFARSTRLRVDGYEAPSVYWEFEEAKSADPNQFGVQTIGIEQNVNWFGAVREQKRVADLGIDIAVLALERTRLRTLSQTHKAIDRILQAQATDRLVAETTQYANEALAISRSRFQSGSGNYIDLLRVRIVAKRMHAERRRVNIEIARTKRELTVLLGMDGQQTPKIEGTLDYTPLSQERSQWLATITEKSPSLQMASKQTTQADKAWRAIRKERGPKMTFGLGLQRLYNGTSAESAWAGKVQLSFPLPGSDRQRGAEGEAKAAYYAIRHRNQRRRLQRIAQLRQRFDKAETLMAQLEDYRRTILPDAEDQRKAAQQAYRVRQIDALNLLDVYNTYLETQRDYLQTLSTYRAAKVDLDTMGEDLQESER